MESVAQITDPATGLPLAEALWQQVALSLFGVASILISVVGAHLSLLMSRHLPAWVNAYVDDKRKNDIHQAAVTIARRIILEGGDPRDQVQVGIGYMVESAKDGFSRLQKNGRSSEEVKRLFGNIFLAKASEMLQSPANSLDEGPGKVPVFDAVPR